MELLLTQATVVVELFGAGYVASSFALYAQRRLNQSQAKWQSRAPVPLEEQSTGNVTERPSPQKSRKPSPTELLRQQCQQAGIKWRNAHGKNKHLKKAEMIAALQQLEREKRRVAQPNVVKPAVHRKAA